MHINDIFENGHKTVLRTIEGLAESDALEPNVCGTWSIKDIMIHLTSLEQILGDLLLSLQGLAPDTQRMHNLIYTDDFNDVVVANNQHRSYQAILADYEEAHEKAASLLAKFPDDLRTASGLIAWYGAEYDLDDFIAYTYYGHKIEHCAQITVFRDRLLQQTAMWE